jgi:hypothetical protein
MFSFLQTCFLFRPKSFCPGKFFKFVEMPGSLTICPFLTASADFVRKKKVYYLFIEIHYNIIVLVKKYDLLVDLRSTSENPDSVKTMF